MLSFRLPVSTKPMAVAGNINLLINLISSLVLIYLQLCAPPLTEFKQGMHKEGITEVNKEYGGKV